VTEAAEVVELLTYCNGICCLILDSDDVS